MGKSRTELALVVLTLAALGLEGLLLFEVLALLRALLLLDLILLVLLLLQHLLVGVMSWAQGWSLMQLSHHLEGSHVGDVVLVDEVIDVARSC